MSKSVDPKVEMRKLQEKVKLLLGDHKMMKETIESQRVEIGALRSGAVSSSTAAAGTADVAAVKAELAARENALKRLEVQLDTERSASRARVEQLEADKERLRQQAISSRELAEKRVPVESTPGRSCWGVGGLGVVAGRLAFPVSDSARRCH